MNKVKSVCMTVIFFLIVLSVSVMCILKPQDEYSKSERRLLNKFPELSLESVFSGEFMENFESYASDQFPKRDALRTVKAYFSKKVLGKLDNNGLYTLKGHISKLESPKNEYMIDYSKKLFTSIKDKYFKDNENVYLSVIPDKNFYLNKNTSYPSFDFLSLQEEMKNDLSFMKYIDVSNLLDIDDYYKTDSHWKQECILDVADYILESLGADNIPKTNPTKNLVYPFYGVYHGQAGISFEPDTITYLTDEITDNLIVNYYDTGSPKKGDLYNMEKANDKDPYEMFLSGSVPLVTLENPMLKNNKHLIMFRDSFGSSLAPLLAKGYEKITVIDIRYIQSSLLGNFVDFENADILFMYSASLLNNSLAMK